MGRISINQSGDWHVEHDRQDIRGWAVYDASGERVGRVRDLVADTNSELVETVVLDNNEEYPARDIEIGYDDKVVYLEGVHATERKEEGAESEPVVKAYGDARVRERKAGETAGFAAHEPAYRKHYRETYTEGEREYGHYHPAYRVGYDYGTSEQYKGRDWDALKGDVRSDYEKHHGEGTWDRVKDAARHAFERARSHTKTSKTGSGTPRGTAGTSRSTGNT